MCGIVGATAQHNIVPALINGLRFLEYRGYDSCGIAILSNKKPIRVRSTKRIVDLEKKITTCFNGFTGIAHTRWATHGPPIINNAHPIFSRNKIAIVHNGIIENYEQLHKMLTNKNYKFVSQTDTEVIAHLIHSLYKGNLFSAVREVVNKLHGSYAIVVMHINEPNIIVGAKSGSPLIIGLGKEENFFTSDIVSLNCITNRFIFLEDGDICELTPDKLNITNNLGNFTKRKIFLQNIKSSSVKLGKYKHFMHKEIFEQPKAIYNTIPKNNIFDASIFGKTAKEIFISIDSVLIFACGTSYYAGLIAKYWIEFIAKIPAQVEIASEYSYRYSIPNPNSLVIAISQSGETADTLTALKKAKYLGHKYTLSISNIDTSTIIRMTELLFLTHAGTEISVASTKAFTSQLIALFILSITIGKIKKYVSIVDEQGYINKLKNLPKTIEKVLKLEPKIIEWSKNISNKENVIFLGRGIHYPIALEGALKLKEIAYIHAEGYPAGELKHGPLALVTKSMPIVIIAPNDKLLEKLKLNIQEVYARGGDIYIFADTGAHIISNKMNIIFMPKYYGLLSPILHVAPLHLLAYHVACMRGTDVDKPRNLAKSVTVE